MPFKNQSIFSYQKHNANATYRNIVGCYMLLAFGNPVATCCDMLGVVGSNLKMVKFFMQHLWMLHDVVVILPGSCNNVAPERAVYFEFHLATRRNMVAKRVQRVAPNNVVICCDRLAGACKCWANNVGRMQIFKSWANCQSSIDEKNTNVKQHEGIKGLREFRTDEVCWWILSM